MNVAAALAKEDGWYDRRRAALGGSDANILMGGDDAAILQLWKEKRGEGESEDLSRVLPVQMGVWTEPFNLYWYGLMTGRSVTNSGEARAHPTYPFMACTLDGLTTTNDGTPAVFEAKHVNAFAKIEEVEQRYQPQVHHNMAVCGVERAVLSVFVGTLKWECTEVELDDWYLAELMDRERAFWAAVQSGEPPVSMPAVAAPVAPEKWRTVDMTGSNEWASLATDWLANRDAAKTFEKATKGIKELVADDVGEAAGHGVVAKRAKNASIRISEAKE